MDNNLEVFAKRFKELRLYYGLSLNDLAIMLNGADRTVVSRWERVLNWPNMKTLIKISNIFAVSMDWLVGNSDFKYSDKKINELEAEFDDTFLVSKIAFPEDYKNVESRKEKYSLKQRAEVHTLFYLLKFNWELFLKEEHKVLDEDESVEKVLLDRCWRKFSIQDRINKYIERIEDVFIGKKGFDEEDL